MGRGNVSRAAALSVVAVLLQAAPAAASLRWRLVARGVARTPTALKGFVAFTRPAATSFIAQLGTRGAAAVEHADFARQGVVAVFGAFGCQDSLIDIHSVVQHGATLAVGLRERPRPPGTAVCMAIFETYRVLTVEKASLSKPYPTRVMVILARS